MGHHLYYVMQEHYQQNGREADGIGPNCGVKRLIATVPSPNGAVATPP